MQCVCANIHVCACTCACLHGARKVDRISADMASLGRAHLVVGLAIGCDLSNNVTPVSNPERCVFEINIEIRQPKFSHGCLLFAAPSHLTRFVDVPSAFCAHKAMTYRISDSLLLCKPLRLAARLSSTAGCCSLCDCRRRRRPRCRRRCSIHGDAAKGSHALDTLERGDGGLGNRCGCYIRCSRCDCCSRCSPCGYSSRSCSS